MIFVSLLIILLVAFWLWMFNDMLNNPALPPCFISLTGGRNARQDWLGAFLLLNIITAGYYYLNEHKSVK